MTTYLSDILDVPELDREIAEKYVRTQVHPDFPYRILNYTEKAQFEKHWNKVTRRCRGLIYNYETNEVIARPFEKFFNYGEYDWVDDAHRNSVVSVTDKMDGSLGIVYMGPDRRLYVATRGSFASEQALHATKVLRTTGMYLAWEANYDAHQADVVTHLVEIVYPGNRIVLDYGNIDDLYYLGGVSIPHGFSWGPNSGWGFDYPGPKTDVMPYTTFQEAIDAAPRDAKEGMVVHILDRDLRVKLKQADYVELHRIITGMNARTVWQHLGNGGTVGDLCAKVPDEFHAWIVKVAGDLLMQQDRIAMEVNEAFVAIYNAVGPDASRGEFAQCAVKSKYAGLLFLRYDDRDIYPKIWAGLRPPGGVTMVAPKSEDES